MQAKGHRFKGGRISVRDLIQHAKEGDLHAAWVLINQIENDLDDNAKDNEIAAYARTFFVQILNAHESEDDARKDLEKALQALSLVRPRGRPKGDQVDPAWRRVEEVRQYLVQRANASELHAHAATFFQTLLELRNDGADTPKDLVSAFETLYLIRRRGKPRRTPFEINKLVARVVMLKRMDCSTDAATDLLDELEIGGESHSKSSYVRAYYDEETGRLMDVATDGELDVLAELPCEDLVYALLLERRLLPK